MAATESTSKLAVLGTPTSSGSETKEVDRLRVNLTCMGHGQLKGCDERSDSSCAATASRGAVEVNAAT